MVHLSRLAEEIAWWSNPRFGFVRVAEAYATGSSMMPNKRNPDPAELVRGRSARAIAALTAVLGLLKGLPLGYQRDLQEDKPPLFGAVAIYEASLAVMAGLVRSLTIDRDRMADAAEDGYTTATTLADVLVRRGVPFRAAHHVVGGLVGQAERDGVRRDAHTNVTEPGSTGRGAQPCDGIRCGRRLSEPFRRQMFQRRKNSRLRHRQATSGGRHGKRTDAPEELERFVKLFQAASSTS